MTTANLETTLAERKSRYGTFESHSALAQQFKRTMQTGASWPALADDQKECLEMVMHKVARILNGDPNYVDSWHDILGYVKLVEQRLQGEQEQPTPVNTTVSPSKIVNIQSGPYCDQCGLQLADFSRETQTKIGRYKEALCSNCAANLSVDTTNWDLLGRL